MQPLDGLSVQLANRPPDHHLEPLDQRSGLDELAAGRELLEVRRHVTGRRGERGQQARKPVSGLAVLTPCDIRKGVASGVAKRVRLGRFRAWVSTRYSRDHLTSTSRGIVREWINRDPSELGPAAPGGSDIIGH